MKEIDAPEDFDLMSEDVLFFENFFSHYTHGEEVLESLDARLKDFSLELIVIDIGTSDLVCKIEKR